MEPSVSKPSVSESFEKLSSRNITAFKPRKISTNSSSGASSISAAFKKSAKTSLSSNGGLDCCNPADSADRSSFMEQSSTND